MRAYLVALLARLCAAVGRRKWLAAGVLGLAGLIGFLVILGARIWSAALARRKAAAGIGAAAVLAAAGAFVGPWEGERLEAYLDRIASPPVWTVCYGETKGVKAGDRYSREQCGAMLITSLAGYRDKLGACIPGLLVAPQGVQVALVSWAYNVGPGAACGSTLARLANAGDWAGACAQLPRWNKAGGKVVAGLANRRAAELKLCNQAIGKG